MIYSDIASDCVVLCVSPLLDDLDARAAGVFSPATKVAFSRQHASLVAWPTRMA